MSAYTGSSLVFGTVWVYDSVVTGTPGKTGIEIYREHTGELAFASWAKPLRIMGVTTAPFGAAEGAYMQVPAGRRYAVISSRSCQWIERGVDTRLTGPQGDGTGAAGSGRFYLLCRRCRFDPPVRQCDAVQRIWPFRADRRDRPLGCGVTANERRGVSDRAMCYSAQITAAYEKLGRQERQARKCPLEPRGQNCCRWELWISRIRSPPSCRRRSRICGCR